jgi:hypothetical protein
VPKTLVAGQKAQVTIGLTIESVEPRQPLSLQISVLAFGVRKDLPVSYLEQPSRSATYSIPFSAGLATAKENTITIGIDQGQIIYHYRK